MIHQPKILQLGKFYPILGGVEKVMYDLMVGLSERGIDCDMLCADLEGSVEPIRLNEHACLYRPKTIVKAYATTLSPSMITTLRRICRSYDIIHVHHPDPMACLALMLSGYKGKVVLHWHSDIQKQKVLLQFYKPLQSWLLRRADLVVGTTPVYVAESPFLQHVQSKLRCLPIGIPPMQPNPKAVEQMLERYAGKKIIFSLGRLVPYKGFCHLIEAAQMLPDDCVVLIGGSGPLGDSLQNQIEVLGLHDKVKLLGRISDEEVKACFGACRLFCLSSVQKTEAFGIVQLEAMSCGKPVVATRIPHSGVAWVNAHGESGLNVEPQNARQLAEAITRLVQDEDLYQQLSMGALKRYQHLFTKDKTIDNLLALYSELWKNKR